MMEVKTETVRMLASIICTVEKEMRESEQTIAFMYLEQIGGGGGGCGGERLKGALILHHVGVGIEC